MIAYYDNGPGTAARLQKQYGPVSLRLARARFMESAQHAAASGFDTPVEAYTSTLLGPNFDLFPRIGILGLTEANETVLTFLESVVRTTDGNVWDSSWLFPGKASIKVYEAMQLGLFFYFGGCCTGRGEVKLICNGDRAGFPTGDSEPVAILNRGGGEWERLRKAAATAEVLCLPRDGERTAGDAASIVFANSVANSKDGGTMPVGPDREQPHSISELMRCHSDTCALCLPERRCD